VALRIKEPTLRRPFRVPGGMPGAVLLGVFPASLLIFSIVHGQSEQILGMSGLAFGSLLIVGGFVVYGAGYAVRKDGWVATTIKQRKAA
jgi:amino acid transporter